MLSMYISFKDTFSEINLYGTSKSLKKSFPKKEVINVGKSSEQQKKVEENSYNRKNASALHLI